MSVPCCSVDALSEKANSTYFDLFLYAAYAYASIPVQVATVVLGAWMLSNGVTGGQRLWIAPSLVFGLGFMDSARLGLCTESWVCSTLAGCLHLLPVPPRRK